MSSTSERKRPVAAVIGGGYAGYAAATGLDEFVDVILVEPRDAFVHNVAALRALVDPEWLPRIFLPYERLLANGSVVRDRATAVDSARVTLASGAELTPDFIVLATGSTYPYPAKSGTDETATAVERYRETHEELERAPRVLIVGAGPTGLELAGEISDRWPEKQITILEPEPEILAGEYKQELRDEVRRQLEARGVEFVLGDPLTAEPETEPASFGPFAVSTRAGRTIDADIWFRCYGLAPVSDYLRGDLAGARLPDGWIEVTPKLQVAGQTHVFAIGDASSADLKTAGRAGREAEVVVTNIRALLEGGALEDYAPMPPAIVIPLGPSGGASELPGQDEIAGPEKTAAIKGEHMFIDMYRERFGLAAPAPAVGD
ncbi:MAG TPA: FAD-dependent oxidoreductase [Gaiellaceae bacterium]|jgi:NADH dehydrogenase FAD-containing subunit|nr:FAD-dependent oxidoreductase [Gaiellaceae bacterium]